MINQIYYNGPILTMEAKMDAEALYIHNGIIEKVGKKEDIFPYKNKSTKMIDLQGKTLMPAFIDPHSHVTAFADTLRLVPLGEATSFEDIIDKMCTFKKEKKIEQGQWLVGFGYDNNNLAEQKHPTKEILDKISTENPIIMSHASGHMGVANSLALEKLGITKETKDPKGGHIGRNENGEPNGYLEENAFIHNSEKIPQPSLTERCKLIDEAQHIYFSYGITTAQEGIVNEHEWQLLEQMATQKRLILEMVAYIDLKNSKHLAEENKQYICHYLNGLKIGGYKIFLDGSPQGKTAWLTKPYENEKDGYRGYPIYKDEEVEKFVKTAEEEKMQLLTHCNGDAAADQLLHAFEKVRQEGDDNHIRPVMIHAQTVRADQIVLMKKIGMIPSFFIAHTYYWGDVHLKNLGEERASRISPARTAIENGVLYTFHQDTPVVPPDMLHTIWCAVNRITKAGVVLGEEQRITALEALKGVTIHAAYQYYEEGTKGSLKEGKVADLIILDKNPLTVDPMKIKDIQVLITIKNGVVVYKKQDE